MRKLATIQKILDIKEHFNADNLEIATVLGWQVVVKKGEFQKDQLCVFCEIDSFLPVIPQFEFLRKGYYKKLNHREGFRIRTIKLRQQISQGLVFLIDDFEQLKNIEWQIGDEVTDLLGIVQYELPQKNSVQFLQNIKSFFPSFIPKTDQERIQNIWHKYRKKYGDIKFHVSLKLDGTSATYYYNDGEIGLCSRNYELKLERYDAYHEIEKKYSIFKCLKKYGKNIAIQGEIIGEKIQVNSEKIKGKEFYIFDIYDIDNKRYFLPSEVDIMIRKIFEIYLGPNYLRIPKITILENNSHAVTLNKFESLDAILKTAEGRSLNSDCREGLVFRSEDYVDGQVISFKIISNEFLLKEK